MPTLSRRVSVLQGIGLAVGMVVGSGLFGLPGLVLDLLGPRHALLAWLLATAVVAPMILIFIRLGIRYPEAGGLSKYAQVALSDWAEYGVTTVLLGTYTIGTPALALIGAAYLKPLLGAFFLPAEALAFLLLLVATLINAFGVRMASVFNAVSVGMIFLLILAMVLAHPSMTSAGLKAAFQLGLSEPLDLAKLWHAVVLLFWAYLGWENLSFGLEEFRDPKRTIPRVYWGSFALVALTYIVLAATASGAALSGVPVHGLGGLAALLPEAVRAFLLVVIVALILANANAWVFGSSRLVFAAARSGILPKFLAGLDARKTPVAALFALLGFYFLFLLAKYALGIPVATIIAVVSQNFIVLYGIALIAYAKLFRERRDRLVLTASAAVVLILLAGFQAWLVYPLSLLFLGFLAWRRAGRL